ncbi:DUF1127 domain-containing protein [Paracoccus sp. Z118]|uniref:DUF1127 domain-containing protein n=1 Tax=Paracoccus sp. Z118 TaxID=2851017 RepID=UPI001C2C5288|nr:DUF1127 domain-containing protein [Paracoccus sp. Z118]MBV0891896.1 DUF1127 domain-containing protein [Paracoccus sp. Z118]
MSAIDFARAEGRGSSIGFGTKLKSAITAWYDMRTTRNALNRLTDRELDDIGLSRSDIDAVARRGR